MEPAHALIQLLDPAAPPVTMPVAVVVAHPDDEAIGCGSQLSRFRDLKLVVATNGAPEDPVFAHRAGCAPAEYATMRSYELDAATALAGVPAARIARFGVPDQGAAAAMAAIARRLVPLLDGTALVLTHAYEGGHPDHDAMAWAVQHAAALLPAGRRPLVLAMPYYAAEPGGGTRRQAFATEDPATDALLPTTPSGRALRSAMLDAHASQARTVAPFRDLRERVRVQAAIDFSMLPNGGLFRYDGFGWTFKSRHWPDAVAAATQALGEVTP